MPKFFDRDDSSHLFQKALEMMESGSDLSSRTVANNWRHDHRVPVPRDKILQGYYTTPPENGETLRTGLESYLEKEIYSAREPDFYRSDRNSDNELVPKGKQSLLRVVSLNSYAFRQASLRLPERRGVSDDQYSVWLNELLMDQSADLKVFLEGWFAQYNSFARQPQNAGRPTWVCFESEAEAILSNPNWAGRIRDALGLAHFAQGDWLVPLRYDASEVGILFRPTSLDAGWSWAHFPSPRRHAYGIAMDLVESNDGVLLHECIHLLHELEIRHWTGLIGQVKLDPSDSPVTCRLRHWARLTKEFGEVEIKQWMASAI